MTPPKFAIGERAGCVGMNKHDLWQAYLKKNPHWLTDNVTLTPAGIKKLFDQTYDQAHAHAQGVANGKAIKSRLEREKPSRSSTSSDIFNKILGGK